MLSLPPLKEMYHTHFKWHQLKLLLWIQASLLNIDDIWPSSSLKGTQESRELRDFFWSLFLGFLGRIQSPAEHWGSRESCYISPDFFREERTQPFTLLIVPSVEFLTHWNCKLVEIRCIRSLSLCTIPHIKKHYECSNLSLVPSIGQMLTSVGQYCVTCNALLKLLDLN